MDKKHRKGKKCPACCCGGGYVHKDCGGKWHEVVVDDIDEGYGYEWVHNYRCEKCDEEAFYPGYEDIKIEFEDESH